MRFFTFSILGVNGFCIHALSLRDAFWTVLNQRFQLKLSAIDFSECFHSVLSFSFIHLFLTNIYTAFLQCFHLEVLFSDYYQLMFSVICFQNTALFTNLSRLYNNSLDDLDIWPLGMLETTEQGPGPLFRTIIKDQFLRIRDGDRFWFENYKQTK